MVPAHTAMPVAAAHMTAAHMTPADVPATAASGTASAIMHADFLPRLAVVAPGGRIRRPYRRGRISLNVSNSV